MLHVKNIFKTFESKTVLNDLSLTIPDGSVGILLGGSGTGKSTLLRIIAGLDNQDSGMLMYHNMPLKKEVVGMVFQQFNLFENLTVEENIAFGLYAGRTTYTKSDAYARASELLTQYEMAEFKKSYPDELSGGQKQRLAILRTIAQKPSIICFDEPTSALDPLLKSYVAQTIMDLSYAGYTILVATHDIQVVQQLHGTLYLMQAGAIVEEATTQAFFNKQDQFPALKKFIFHT